MARMTAKGNRIVSSRVREFADEFETTLLHNHVAIVDDGDDLVMELADAAGRAYYAMRTAHDTDRDENPVHERAEDAHYAALEALGDHLEELVAKRCAETIEYTYSDRGQERHETDELVDARHEAREWLQEHRDAAKRAGVWAEVSS
ncbi:MULTISPECIES: hypothetical protein [unclassified Natrinema]|uniref:hypothetical protein n=1 Tax=unclassified Natrinema TaxID=2622230 RepID=UPI00026D485C|nr:MULTISPECIES: hypothetical protein [unclassified Natrinema]AFO57023.1 hypothetical protein NJ7G_1780 [Natrinema sp. J7-2]